MRFQSALLVAGMIVGGASAQGVNCALLGTFANHGPFNDVWGYTAPNGDEYALLLATTGTVVVDITNPATPIERGWFPYGSSTWRDCRTYGHYAYVVTEATAGFQIIDLSNPNAPVEVGIFGTAQSPNAHNVCIDTSTGLMYLVGSNSGTPTWDLTTNPANPTYLGLANGTGQGNYYHDLCVENGYFYGSMIYNGVLQIRDASTFPPTTLSTAPTPGDFTHNAWPNAAGTLCVTTDEVTGGVIKLFDITNKSNPIPLGQFTPNPASIPHNAYIVGDKVHVSWYTEGYRCIDISDPSNPVEVASYDTWPGATGGYNGCWGCYPFLPSGNILASDRNTGLYIVKPSSAAFTKYGSGCVGSATEACPELNAAGGTLSNNTNANEYTYPVTVGAPIQVNSFEIYTRASTAQITRPAHIYLAGANGPQATPFASTTITVGTTAGFYTATFASPVTVNGTFYIGYENGNGGVISNLTTGDNGTGWYRASAANSWQLSGVVQHPAYIVNCTSSVQLAPAIGNTSSPIIGTSYGVTVSDTIPSTIAVLVTGFANQLPPVALPGAPGCDLLVGADVLQPYITVAPGTASGSFAVPNSPVWAGISLYHQWAVFDAVNPLGIVMSNAAQATFDY